VIVFYFFAYIRCLSQTRTGGTCGRFLLLLSCKFLIANATKFYKSAMSLGLFLRFSTSLLSLRFAATCLRARRYF